MNDTSNPTPQTVDTESATPVAAHGHRPWRNRLVRYAAVGAVAAVVAVTLTSITGQQGDTVTATRRTVATSAVAYDLVTTLNEKIAKMRLAAPEASRLYGYTFLAAYAAAKQAGDGVDPEAAAASAGAQTAAGLVANGMHARDFLLLAPRHGTQSDEAADELGSRIARAVIALAANDVYTAGAGAWRQTNAPGPFDYQPTGRGEPPLEPTWGEQPTIIPAAATCALPSPDTAVVVAQAEAMRSSFTKTTALGNDVFWWLAGNGTATPTGQWMRMAANAARDANLSAPDALTFLARAAIAAADAGVVGWREKFRHNLLRPESLWAQQDGAGAPQLPRETPNHPSYPSGHSFFGGAVASTVVDVIGDVPVRDNLPADLYAPAETRNWARVTDALAEAGRSRVDAGFHYPLDVTAGQDLGACVAKAVATGLDELAASIRPA